MPSLLAVIVLGVFSGVAGMMFVLPYATSMTADKAWFDAQLTPNALRTRNSSEPALESLLPASRASVLFAVPKPPTGSVPQSYVPGDAIAMGMVVTSDGWLAAIEPPAAAKRRLADTVALVGGEAHRVTKTVYDAFSGVTFLKIEAENLPVTAFGDSTDLTAGDVLFGIDASGAVHRSEVLAHDTLPAGTVAEALRSSEQLQRHIRLVAGADAPLSGALLLNGKGEIVALSAGRQSFGVVAIPIEAFQDVLGSVLRGQALERPYLGVHYVDLSLLAVVGGSSLPKRGAQLSTSLDGKQQAIVRGSPAFTAGLRAGDVIVAVDGEQISGKNPLAKAVAQYAPGDTVTLKLSRGVAAASMDVDVTLGTAPAK